MPCRFLHFLKRQIIQKQTLMMMMMVAAQRTLIRAVKNMYTPKINLLKLAWTKRSDGQELFLFSHLCLCDTKKSKLTGSCFFLPESSCGLLFWRTRAETVNFIGDALLMVVLCRAVWNTALCSRGRARREISTGNYRATQSRIQGSLGSFSVPLATLPGSGVQVCGCSPWSTSLCPDSWDHLICGTGDLVTVPFAVPLVQTG